MLSSIVQSGFLAAALFSVESIAGLVAMPVPQKPTDLELFPTLDKRSSIVTLGSFSLATSKENANLFSIAASKSSDGVTETGALKVGCIDCRTWGTAVVTNSGVTKGSILSDFLEFFKDPLEAVTSGFDLDIKVDFQGVGGHFEFDIVASDTVSYSIPIYTSISPVGIAVSEDISIGLVLIIDLVFSLTAAIDIDAGFEFSFPEDAYITVDPLGGNIVESSFTGGTTNSLPITVTSGSATFKAALRVRVQAGTTVEVFGDGFDFELGVSADLIEYVAVFATTPACKVSITEFIDVNIGAYAHAVAEIDYQTFGASPASVTTILSVPLPSLCITAAQSTKASTTSVLASATALPASSSAGQVTSTAVLASPTASVSSAIATESESLSSTETGIFFQSSTAVIDTAAASSTLAANTTSGTGFPISVSSPLASATSYRNGTITSPAALQTSTVFSTTLITVTSCSSTVLHCPASLQSEVVVTSVIALYTTICPVTASQTALATLALTSTPAIAAESVVLTTSQVIVTNTVIGSGMTLTPLSTPVVSTIYTPTFVNPTYTTPTASSSWAPAFPNWNATQTATLGATGVKVEEVASTTATSAGVVTAVKSVAVVPTPEATSLIVGAGTGCSGGCGKSNTTAKATGTGSVTAQSAKPTQFIGAASSLRVGGSVLVVVMGFVLLL